MPDESASDPIDHVAKWRQKQPVRDSHMRRVTAMGKNGITVSLINLNLVVEDAIGTCIINQARFFQQRGDEVHIYVLHPYFDLPADIEEVTRIVTLADLIGGGQGHFLVSDLYIYHYPGRHELMESIRGIDRGVVIFYYHNVTPPELWGSDADREILMRGMEGKALVHYADLCITPSPFNKQDLVEGVGYDPDRIFVVPLAVPLEQFTPGARDPELARRFDLEGQRVLLFVGRMAGNKRIDLLVEALARVKREEPSTKLLLVGDDRGAPAYREIVAAARTRASELGIAGDVIWTGRVDELPLYFRLADVCVSASLHEGFGVPLIEAMASGVPVVASRAGAMPWVLEDAGLLFEPGNAGELADKVLMVLRDANLHQALVERGLERVQAFSLDRYEAGLAEIVDQALTYTLPRAMQEPTAGAHREAAAQQDLAPGGETLLGILAEEIGKRSDIALRDYQLRSRAPLVGPLIVWIRRNLTSHLREPYLDLMIESQVELNRQTAEWMGRAANVVATSTQRQSELEARVKALEAQVRALARGQDEEELGKER
jgi:glycosyltransferase involved in cell wall biosynthesis